MFGRDKADLCWTARAAAAAAAAADRRRGTGGTGEELPSLSLPDVASPDPATERPTFGLAAETVTFPHRRQLRVSISFNAVL